MYESLEQVATRGQILVRGVVGSVVSEELDGGGNRPETPETALPVKFIELKVATSSDQTTVKPGSTVNVLWDKFSPSTEGRTQPASQLEAGQEVILFAIPKTAAEAPGIDTVTEFLAPVGGEAGVLDVAGGVATSRGSTISSLAGPGGDAANMAEGAQSPLVVPVDDVLALAGVIGQG